MDDNKALEIVDKVFDNAFNCKNPYSLDEVLTKFAFDIKLPQQVRDTTTGEITWAVSVNPTRFITMTNAAKNDTTDAWMLPKQPVKSLSEILDIWKKVNYTTTERQYNSVDVIKSDTIYNSENVYRSCNSSMSKNLIFCDSCHNSEFLLACQRTGGSNFCIRVDDSFGCSNSYNVVCSGNISNSYFIQDCNTLHECIFCAHISNKRYCIANMQFEKEEYFAIKKEITKWILNS